MAIYSPDLREMNGFSLPWDVSWSFDDPVYLTANFYKDILLVEFIYIDKLKVH